MATITDSSSSCAQVCKIQVSATNSTNASRTSQDKMQTWWMEVTRIEVTEIISKMLEEPQPTMFRIVRTKINSNNPRMLELWWVANKTFPTMLTSQLTRKIWTTLASTAQMMNKSMISLMMSLQAERTKISQIRTISLNPVFKTIHFNNKSTLNRMKIRRITSQALNELMAETDSTGSDISKGALDLTGKSKTMMMKMMERKTRKVIAQMLLLSKSLVTMLRQTSKPELMVMMSTTQWTKRFTSKSTGKVEANRISTRHSSTKGNNNTINSSSKTRGETCNSSKDPRVREDLIQISKRTIWDLKWIMGSIKVREIM